jgi:CRP-like cAMP-binding protein
VERTRLEQFPIFSQLGPDELDAVASVSSEADVEAGTELAVEGDFGHSLFAIESGTADVSRGGEVVRTLGQGDVFGEIAVLASGRRTATVVATSPMKLIAIFKRDVWALERRSPEAAERLRGLVAERLAGQTS